MLGQAGDGQDNSGESLNPPRAGKRRACTLRASDRTAVEQNASDAAERGERRDRNMPRGVQVEPTHHRSVAALVVVDEVSLLDCLQFERMIKLWSVANKVPALVFLGDKYQLPGVGETRAWESAAWKKPQCFHVTLDEAWRCKEQRFQDILDEIRTDMPSEETLNKICRGAESMAQRQPYAR